MKSVANLMLRVAWSSGRSAGLRLKGLLSDCLYFCSGSALVGLPSLIMLGTYICLP
ncbi:hypothetical protein 2200_scaffold1335_00056 [Bacteriophage sp.]|nr:hypothetical protein 2200_scaffold1335_00056 [Bacteriophage sp.]